MTVTLIIVLTSSIMAGFYFIVCTSSASYVLFTRSDSTDIKILFGSRLVTQWHES
jgi:hypothetical protein